MQFLERFTWDCEVGHMEIIHVFWASFTFRKGCNTKNIKIERKIGLCWVCKRLRLKEFLREIVTILLIFFSGFLSWLLSVDVDFNAKHDKLWVFFIFQFCSFSFLVKIFCWIRSWLNWLNITWYYLINLDSNSNKNKQTTYNKYIFQLLQQNFHILFKLNFLSLIITKFHDWIVLEISTLSPVIYDLSLFNFYWIRTYQK